MAEVFRTEGDFGDLDKALDRFTSGMQGAGKSAENMAKTSSASFASLEQKGKASMDSMTRSAGQLESKMGTLGRVLKSFSSQGAASRLIFLGLDLQQAALSLGLFTAPLAAAAAASVKFATDFDSAMRAVNVLLQLNETAFQEFSDQVILLAARPDIIKSPLDLAKGLEILASTGYEGARALAVLGPATQAATAGFTDSKTVINGLIRILEAYAGSNLTATRSLDLMFETVDKGIISFPQLSEGIGEVVGFAGTAGIKFDELSAAIASMSKVLPPAETFTSLGRLILGIAAPGTEAARAAKEMGIEFNQTALESKGLFGVLQDVQKATSGNVSSLRSLFPELRGYRGAVVLMRDSTRDFAASMGFMSEQGESAGASTRALAEAMKSPAVQLEKFVNSMQVAGIQMGAHLIPTMRSGLEVVSGFAKALSSLPQPAQDAFLAFTALSVAVTGGTLIFGRLITLVAAGVNFVVTWNKTLAESTLAESAESAAATKLAAAHGTSAAAIEADTLATQQNTQAAVANAAAKGAAATATEAQATAQASATGLVGITPAFTQAGTGVVRYRDELGRLVSQQKVAELAQSSLARETIASTAATAAGTAALSAGSQERIRQVEAIAAQSGISLRNLSAERAGLLGLADAQTSAALANQERIRAIMAQAGIAESSISAERAALLGLTSTTQGAAVASQGLFSVLASGIATAFSLASVLGLVVGALEGIGFAAHSAISNMQGLKGLDFTEFLSSQLEVGKAMVGLQTHAQAFANIQQKMAEAQVKPSSEVASSIESAKFAYKDFVATAEEELPKVKAQLESLAETSLSSKVRENAIAALKRIGNEGAKAIAQPVFDSLLPSQRSDIKNFARQLTQQMESSIPEIKSAAQRAFAELKSSIGPIPGIEAEVTAPVSIGAVVAPEVRAKQLELINLQAEQAAGAKLLGDRVDFLKEEIKALDRQQELAARGMRGLQDALDVTRDKVSALKESLQSAKDRLREFSEPDLGQIALQQQIDDTGTEMAKVGLEINQIKSNWVDRLHEMDRAVTENRLAWLEMTQSLKAQLAGVEDALFATQMKLANLRLSALDIEDSFSPALARAEKDVLELRLKMLEAGDDIKSFFFDLAEAQRVELREGTPVIFQFFKQLDAARKGKGGQAKTPEQQALDEAEKRLEILRLKEQIALADIKASQEAAQREAERLQLQKQITWDPQVRELEKMGENLRTQQEILQLRQQLELDELNNQTELLGLEQERLRLTKETTFDVQLRQLKAMLDTTKKMTFDEAVQGIQDTQHEISILEGDLRDQLAIQKEQETALKGAQRAAQALSDLISDERFALEKSTEAQDGFNKSMGAHLAQLKQEIEDLKTGKDLMLEFTASLTGSQKKFLAIATDFEKFFETGFNLPGAAGPGLPRTVPTIQARPSITGPGGVPIELPTLSDIPPAITGGLSDLGKTIGSGLSKLGETIGEGLDALANPPPSPGPEIVPGGAFQSGGVVPGPIGQPQFAVVEGGEKFFGAPGATSNITNWNINIQNTTQGQDILSQMKREVMMRRMIGR